MEPVPLAHDDITLGPEVRVISSPAQAVQQALLESQEKQAAKAQKNALKFAQTVKKRNQQFLILGDSNGSDMTMGVGERVIDFYPEFDTPLRRYKCCKMLRTAHKDSFVSSIVAAGNLRGYITAMDFAQTQLEQFREIPEVEAKDEAKIYSITCIGSALALLVLFLTSKFSQSTALTSSLVLVLLSLGILSGFLALCTEAWYKVLIVRHNATRNHIRMISVTATGAWDNFCKFVVQAQSDIPAAIIVPPVANAHSPLGVPSNGVSAATNANAAAPVAPVDANAGRNANIDVPVAVAPAARAPTLNNAGAVEGKKIVPTSLARMIIDYGSTMMDSFDTLSVLARLVPTLQLCMRILIALSIAFTTAAQGIVTTASTNTTMA